MPSFPQTGPTGPAQRDDEIFDVVNEHDEPIGQATRREVHSQKLWHRATHVVVTDGRGSVFLQKRSMAKDTAPGRWDSACSGHLDAGETYALGAVRELREEIGLVINGPEVLTPLFKLTPSERNGWEFIMIFCLRSDGPFVLHPAEIERGDWWRIEDLSRAIEEKPQQFTNALKMLWSRLLSEKPDCLKY